MKPVIGIVPLVDEERDSLWMLPGYMDATTRAGGLPLMLPLTGDEDSIKQLCALCDGFLLTGGHDVSPTVYGAEKLPSCGACSPERDQMEAGILRWALALDKPVLGICRGIQFINAALGGTLWQDLPSQRPSPVEHHQTPPYDKPAHKVQILPDTPLAEALGAGERTVNSYHHQAIRALAPELEPMAISEDGLVEAVWRPESRFVWAVQWHPEFAWKTDPAAMAVFEAFVAASAGRA